MGEKGIQSRSNSRESEDRTQALIQTAPASPALDSLKHLSTWSPRLRPLLPEEPHTLPAYLVPPNPPTQLEAQGFGALQSLWVGSSHLLLSFLFMLPGGGGVEGILQESCSAPPTSSMLQLLSPLGAGASSAGKERGTAPPHPAPGQGEGRGWGETKGPPPPTWGSLQAEVSGAAGPHPQSPSGLALYLPYLSVSRPVILCSVIFILQQKQVFFK